MSLSAGEIERLRLIAWRNASKGKGIRWRLIRATMAVVSGYWMTLSEVETCMVRIWGLTRNKTREILDEMVEIGDCLFERDEKTHEMKYHLNPSRASLWLGQRVGEAIPAGIVQVVETTLDASKLERDRRIPGGPSS